MRSLARSCLPLLLFSRLQVAHSDAAQLAAVIDTEQVGGSHGAAAATRATLIPGARWRMANIQWSSGPAKS